MVLLGSTVDNKRYTALLSKIVVYAFKASITAINNRPPLVLRTRQYVRDRVETLRQMYNPAALKPSVVVVEDDPSRQGYPTESVTNTTAASIRRMRKACAEGDANELGSALTTGRACDVYAFTLTGNHSTQAAAELLACGHDIPPTREALIFLRSALSDDDLAFISVYENTLAQEEAGATSLYRDYASPRNLVRLIRAHYKDMKKPTPAQRAGRDCGRTFAARLDRMESPRNAPGENDAMAEEKRQQRHAALVQFDRRKADLDATALSTSEEPGIYNERLKKVRPGVPLCIATVRGSRTVPRHRAQ